MQYTTLVAQQLCEYGYNERIELNADNEKQRKMVMKQTCDWDEDFEVTFTVTMHPEEWD